MKIYAYRTGELNKASIVKTGAERPSYTVDFTDAMPGTMAFFSTVTTALDSKGNTVTANCVAGTTFAGNQATIAMLPCGATPDNPATDGSRFKLTTTATMTNGEVAVYELYVLTVDPAYSPIPGGEVSTPQPCDCPSLVFNIMDYGAVGDGVTDDTLAIQQTINAAGSGNTIWIPCPPQNYKVTSTLNISHQTGLRMIAASAHGGNNLASLPTLQWAGPSGGIVLQLDCVRDSDFQGFAIMPTTPIGISISIDQITPGGSYVSANNKFSRLCIDSSDTGIAIGNLQSTSQNNSEHTFTDVYVFGDGTYGVYIKYGQSRNISFERGSYGNRNYGIYLNDGSCRIYGVNFNENGTDVYVQNADDTINIIKCHSELSAMFLDTGGYSGTAFACSLISNEYVPGSWTGPLLIQYKYMGPITLIGNDFAAGTPFDGTLFNCSTAIPSTLIKSIGNIWPNFNVWNGAVGQYTLRAENDMYINASYTPTPMPIVPAPLTAESLIADSAFIKAITDALGRK